MIILFDTYAGLCNQMYDIISAIKFMKEYRIPICFRYASFRKSNLVQFYPVPFQNLFSEEPFLNETYYIPYHSIEKDIKYENTFNWEGKRCIELWGKKPVQFISILKNIKKKYIILRQPWSLDLFPFENKELVHWIQPNHFLLECYQNILKTLQLPKEYLFLHYRYEYDFIRFFKLKVISLQSILDKVNKNKEPIYIASTKIDTLLKKKEPYFYYKKEMEELNFEEKAMIDFLFGIHSKRVYGHSRSSFSRVLNDMKETNNYYS